MVSRLNEKLKIALVVLSYFTVSILMVLMNKSLLSRSKGNQIPFFITWYQCVITAIICWLLGKLGKVSRKDSWVHSFPEQHYHFKTAISVFPLSAIFVGMITFNNLCLQHVTVSFYLVARSLTIVFNVILSYAILGLTTSLPVIACCGIVIFGFFIGSEGEVAFSFLGTVFGVFASLFVSLNSIFTKKMISVVDNNSWKLCFYNNMNSSLLFIPLILLFEKDIFRNPKLYFSSSFWWMMTIAGVLGFLIGIVTIAQISLTSPLTHNISGTAKACLQTLIAVLFLKEKMSFRSLIGIVCVLFGTFMYSVVRSREMDRIKARNSPKLAPTPAVIDMDEEKPLLTKRDP